MAWRWAVTAGLTSLILIASASIWFSGSVAAADANANEERGDSFIGNSAGQNTDDGLITGEATRPSCCEYRSVERKPYVLVSTLDGRISAIDASSSGGQLAWTLQTDGEPLLSSSLSNIPFFYDDREFRLIPSMDGHFYMYNDAAVQSVPFNVDALLSGSLKLGADVLAGGKQIRTYFIDYISGKLHQTCSATGCEQFGDQASIFQKLIIKRTTQTVRGVDPSTGAERWNLTVGEHELLLDDSNEMTNNEGSCICVSDHEKLMYSRGGNTQPASTSKHNWEPSDYAEVDLKIVPPEGLLMGYDKNDPSVLLWERKLESPIVQIWTLSSDGALVERTIFDQNLIPAFSYYSVNEAQSFASSEVAGRYGGGQHQTEKMIYIGTYNDQKYVVRSPEERRKLKDLRGDVKEQSRVYLLAPAAQLQLEDQSREGEHCGPDCPTCASDEVNALILRDQYPRDMGWYLYKHRTPPHIHHRLKALKETKRPSKRAKAQRHVVEFLGELPFGQFCILFLLVITAIFVPAAIVARFYGQQIRELKSMASKRLNKSKENTAEPTLSTATPATEITNLSPSPSQESNPLTALLTDLTGRSYGRFQGDFEPIRQLGKGGFGIVMESRNKHDDQLYAVKRIAFALNRSAKERVRREVKALAQLDHPGIVRYFSAWFEEPPADWQKMVDQEMFQKCHRSVDDELNLESMSVKHARPLEASLTESLAPKIGPFGDIANGNFAENPSTFGSWTDEGQVETEKEEPSIENDSDGSDEGRPLLAAPHQHGQNLQESVEIIFAHSTTNVSNLLSSNSEVSKRQQRKSSSSKHSSTKSDEENKEPGSKSITVGTAYLYIQMQLCRGTLKDWLLANNSREHRDRSDMLDWFDQLVCAMQYVHDLGLVHRDLKPSNIFFSTTGLLKIGDFGLATTALPSVLPSDVSSEQDAAVNGEKTTLLLSSAFTMSPSKGTTDRVGTQLYMSPEQEAGKKCTSKADIYALGLILIELLVPFKTLMERIHVIQDARRNVFPAEFKKDCAEEYDLVRQLLAHDPEMRPTCTEIRQFDLFRPCLAVRPLFSQNGHCQPGRSLSRDSERHSSASISTL